MGRKLVCDGCNGFFDPEGVMPLIWCGWVFCCDGCRQSFVERMKNGEV